MTVKLPWNIAPRTDSSETSEREKYLPDSLGNTRE